VAEEAMVEEAMVEARKAAAASRTPKANRARRFSHESEAALKAYAKHPDHMAVANKRKNEDDPQAMRAVFVFLLEGKPPDAFSSFSAPRPNGQAGRA
jgi:hypothetical protein